jgi:nucleotide sugar dehydrogenase
VGLGKIGLPLSVKIAESGVSVQGADIEPRVVAQINGGGEPFPGEPELSDRLASVIDSGMLTTTMHTNEAVANADVVVVVVPLVVDEYGDPDFSAIDAATTSIASNLKQGALVIYETTVPVGTTRQRLTPMLTSGSGFEPGSGLLVAFSPERVSSGSVFRDLRRYPKLVGGIDWESTEAAAAFYEQVLEFDERPDLNRPNGVWRLDSAEAAELTKLAETTYRDINIGFANELAAHAESVGVDAWQLIEAANSQPFSHIHRPGIAVGGHCIPIYPHLYLANDQEARLPRRSREVNSFQPIRLIDRLSSAAGTLDGLKVAVLGAAYRGGVKETAFSGAFDVVEQIEKRGGRPFVHDPLFDDDELRKLGFEPFHLGERCDTAVIQTDHPEYSQLTPEDLPGCSVLLDGRAIVDAEAWRAANRQILVVGRP